MSQLLDNVPFEFLPWLAALGLDALLGHTRFLALVSELLASGPLSQMFLLLIIFVILAIRQIRSNPRRLAIVIIALALFLAGGFIMLTEEIVWSPILDEYPSWRFARIIAPSDEERAHSLLMLSLGISLLLSGTLALLNQTSSWSRIIRLASVFFPKT